MAKVELDPCKRQLRKALNYISNEMRRQKVTQLAMAKELGLSSQAYFSTKLSNQYFTLEEVIKMMNLLHITFEELGENL